jgi:hypothetical protein
MSALTDFFDVVEHLVNTHSTWNMNLSKDEALLKVAAARAEELAKTVAPVVDEVAPIVEAVVPAAGPTIEDVQKMLDGIRDGGVEA